MSATFDLAEFHRRAVETDSTESVDEMRTVLLDTLDAADVAASVDDLGNVVATRGAADHEAAASADTHLVFNTHIDTVPPHVPYERRTERPGDEAVDGSEDAGEGDVVCGRGSCDAKGPLAALLDAFLTVDPDDGAVTLAVSIDEETTQTGGAHLAETIDADGYIVGEPTGLDVCTAAKGQFEGTVTIHGESAHAADPGSGLNAIRAAAPILQALESYDEREARSASEGPSGDDGEPRGPDDHETLGRPILTPSMVEGGEATNQVPAECTITFDRRSVPPETSDAFCATLEEHLRGWLPDAMSLDVALIRPDTPFPEAFATDPDAELVRTLQEASGGTVRPFEAATEASYFAQQAPTVVFGPGVLTDEVGAVAHSKREYVRLSDVRTAARAVRETVERLL
ncbi:M20 family metallopeptidase [Haloarcula pellucida]|uniref:Acetylornithine deacetylase n=1 Tax=Haloarcula pellucida TaxID=1427151 RepID=A0A830GGD1_9EURY|nr:M20 family metallopeptidase [Halomicroarcula pellucida]MBX0346831.1 M20 family metallopeptidase [Halomicroarcula pellucida]GGN85687.1 acetylornithine deacetylase [Halomicroarcula pellucida]